MTWNDGWTSKWDFGGPQNGATRKATPKELGLDAQLTPVISCHSRYLSKVEVQPWRKVEWPLFILSDQPITRPTDHTAARHIWSAQYWVVIIHLTFIRPAHFFVWFPTIKPNWLKSEEEGQVGYPGVLLTIWYARIGSWWIITLIRVLCPLEYPTSRIISRNN